MVCAYFGFVNPTTGFFGLLPPVGGGGGWGERLPGAPLCNFKTAHDTATKIRVLNSFFPTFRHNWTDTMMYLDAIMTSYC